MDDINNLTIGVHPEACFGAQHIVNVTSPMSNVRTLCGRQAAGWEYTVGVNAKEFLLRPTRCIGCAAALKLKSKDNPISAILASTEVKARMENAQHLFDTAELTGAANGLRRLADAIDLHKKELRENA